MSQLTVVYVLIYLSNNAELFPLNLNNILTKNETKMWLDNQTEKTNNKNPYCSVCCMDISIRSFGKRCGFHTLCRYQNRLIGPNCKGYIPIHFTDEEILAIVDAHNTLRSHVASGLEHRGSSGGQYTASNMRLIQWDLELAMIAERWAGQCVFAHDICRDTVLYPVGQNIAQGNFAQNNDLEFIKNWYENVNYFNRNDVYTYKIYEDISISDYTQLVWADTYNIGCARVVFQKASGANVNYVEHFFCNYGPAGNLPDQPIYKVGSPCSACQEGTGCSIEYPGLCASELIYEVHKRQQPAKFDHRTIFNKCVRFQIRILDIYMFIILVFLLYFTFD